MTNETKAERDPRIDPRPGDVLRKKYQGQYFESRAYYTRTVHMRGPDVLLRMRDRVYFERDPSHAGICRIGAWRKWAKDATVLHRAE